ncbi:hypothetical protein ES708_08578 [subsurface metagenome]|jgi:DNA-binding CsgD family transcriptional regulator
MASGKYLTAEMKARILELKGRGLTTKQIAARLRISPETVKKYKVGKP